ncbi:MAG: hypothetical protein ACQEWV_31725 [Bacillota bacterium]
MTKLSTGVLNKHTSATTAHVEYPNLDPVNTVKIRGKFIDWGPGVGGPVSVTPFTETLPPNSLSISNHCVSNKGDN